MNKSEQGNGRMSAEVQRENVLQKLAELNQQLDELPYTMDPQTPSERHENDMTDVKRRALKEKIRQIEDFFDRREETGW